MPADRSPGAYVYWDRMWRTGAVPGGSSRWVRPEPEVLRVLAELARPPGRALDIGAGAGRHALTLARAGFTTYAVDRSHAGLQLIAEQAREHGLRVHVVEADFTRLPFAPKSFDYLVAWNVVYHGNAASVSRSADEAVRVLRPGGIYQLTLLSIRNACYGHGQQVSAGTFIDPAGPQDKAHPHYYCDIDDALAHHRPLRLVAAADREQDGHGSSHWHLVFERPRDEANARGWRRDHR
jgi:SAM-dependent methyltransferase